MTKKDLLKKIAQMEFYIDQLETEVENVDDLLKTIGFTDGLASIKRAALELLQKQEKENQATEGSAQ
jgi:hypothetical protein